MSGNAGTRLRGNALTAACPCGPKIGHCSERTEVQRKRSEMPQTLDLPEYVGGFPNLCGSEEVFGDRTRREDPVYLPDSAIDFDRINSCFANALHMHQPLIPAGGEDLCTAKVISNLQAMMKHPEIGDNHNAPAFHSCYKRMGEIIPQLASYHGRIYLGSDKVAAQSPGPGTVLPVLTHGGPGRAGGGEELGGARGMSFYQQRTALQGDKGIIKRLLE